MDTARLVDWLRTLSTARRRAAVCAWSLAATLAQAADAPVASGTPLDPAVEQAVRQLLVDRLGAAAPGRLEAQVGNIDPRLRLAPCAKVEPHLADGVRIGGALRVGLRCTEGSTHWNVYVPVTVRVIGHALGATVPLPAGTVLTAGQLADMEVDLAADPTPLVAGSGASVVGRTLARPVLAGQALHQSHLQPRIWFVVGDLVQVRAKGDGFSVSSEGEALTTGLDGQAARVRTEGGRVLTGIATARHQIELPI